jgi:cytochrome c5
MWLWITVCLAITAFAAVQDLPDGYGRSLLESNCTGCHTLQQVVEKHWDAQGWNDAIAEMREKGSPLAEEDVPDLVEYLTKNFGPVKQDANANTAEQEKKLLETSCTSCHGLDLIEEKRFDKDGWNGVVQQMMALGAQLTPAEIPQLVDYLAKTYPVETK